jgi:hypothetical protein
VSQIGYRIFRPGAAVVALVAVAASVVSIFTLGSADQPSGPPRPSASFGPPPIPPKSTRPGAYPTLASRAIQMIENDFYNGAGEWHMCVPRQPCNTKNRDWGADVLTNILAFRWKLTRDRSVLPLVQRLIQTSHSYAPNQPGSSDTAMWDAVADVREYQVTGSKLALHKAEAAFSWLTSRQQAGFAAGACPSVDYQWTNRNRGDLKTLETGSNYIKAAILLYEATDRRAYLTDAQREYAISRKYFLTKSVPLYTTYIVDNGVTCHRLPGGYFASVNGNMIWSGAALAGLTGRRSYLTQAVATARAIATHLNDSAGVFADLQADNDIVEPLIEAMYKLATTDHQRFARRWLLRAASAAGADMTPAGAFGRFFDGPPPSGMVTAWQTSGGTALMQAAAALDFTGAPAHPDFWRQAIFIRQSRKLTGPRLTITFTGRAIALIGAIGAHCCSLGHARVLVDGVRTFDQTGIWQNRTSPSVRQPGQVLFAWRWRTAGSHTITILPAQYNPVEGGSFFMMTGYLVVR